MWKEKRLITLGPGPAETGKVGQESGYKLSILLSFSIKSLVAHGLSKSTFFQSVNYLQNLGLITLIKKKIG